MRWLLYRVALVAFLPLAVAPTIYAQSWTGVDADQNWNQPGDWNPNTVPNSATAAALFLNQSGPFFFGVANIGTSVQCQSLTFSNTSGNYDITSSVGQTLSGVTSIMVGSGVTTTDTINLASVASGSLLYPSGSSLTITNNAAMGANPTLVIGPSTVIGTSGNGGILVAGTGYTVISGIVGGTTNPVSGGLKKNGSGILVLSNSGNTYGGGTTINGGTLSVSADGDLGNSAGGVTFNGGVLQVTGTGDIAALSASRLVTIQSGGATIDTSSLGAGTGNIVTIAPVIGGTGPLTLNAHGDTSDTGNSSSSELILSGANTFTGTVTINSGLVDAVSGFGNAANTITIAGGGLVAAFNPATVSRNITLSGTGDRIFRVYAGSSMTVGGVISGSGTLRKTDSGLLTLTGSNTYTGGTTIGAGALAVAGDGNLGASSGGLTFTGGTLEAKGTFSSARGVTINSGGGTVSVDSSKTLTLSGTLSGTGALTQAGAGSLTLTGAGSSIDSLNVNAGSVTVGGGSLTLTSTSAPFSIGGGSPTALMVSGGANVTTTATNTFPIIDGSAGTGAVVTGAGSQLNAGYSLYVGNTANGSLTVQNAGSISVAHDLIMGVIGGSVGTLLVQSGGTVTGLFDYVGSNPNATGTVTVTGIGSQFNAANYMYIGHYGNGTVTVANGATATANLQLVLGTNAGAAGTLSIQSGARFSTSNAFFAPNPGTAGTATVTGTGSILSGINLYLGQNGGAAGGIGQLSITNGGAAAFTGITVFGTSGSSITVNGGTFTTNSLATTAGAVPGIFLSDPPGGPALTIGADNSSSVFPGSIADAAGGPGTVDKVGAGDLLLTGHLTNSGGYTASAGTLDFSGALVQPGPGALTAAAGATIQYDSGARVFGGFLRGSGTHIVSGGSMLSGVTTFNSTVVSVTGPASFVNFTNGGTLNAISGLATPTVFSGFVNQGSASITIGTASLVNASDFQSYGTLTINPAAAGSSRITLLTNVGGSPMFFNGGSRTFIGTPATASLNEAGVDLGGQNLVVAGGLFVNNGFVADSTSTPGSVIVDFGALFKGAGTNFVNVITQNGGRVQAGNSPGSMGFGRLVLGPGGVNSYVFAIDDATGQAGPSPNANGQVSGWGLVKAVKQSWPGSQAPVTSGDFVWTATSGNKWTVAIDTLVNPTTVGTDVAGPMADFDPARPYSWTAAQWAGTYSGPVDAPALDSATTFDTSGVVNPIAGTFGWNLDTADQTLSLTYTPTAVPEPGTLALTGLAAIGWVRCWRRRRRTDVVRPV